MNETDLSRLLLDQARAAMEQFRAVERYFQGLGLPAAEEARRRAGEAAAAGRGLEEALEGGQAPRGWRKDLFILSRHLGRMAAEGRALVEEAVRFGVGEEPGLQDMAHASRRSAEELASAVEALAARTPSGEGRAVAAARAAGRTETVRRAETRGLGDEPDAVLAIKLRGLHRRFSSAALHAAEAADQIGAMLTRWR